MHVLIRALLHNTRMCAHMHDTFEELTLSRVSQMVHEFCSMENVIGAGTVDHSGTEGSSQQPNQGKVS